MHEPPGFALCATTWSLVDPTGWTPVPVLLTAMLVLGFMGPREPYESQPLLMVLNFLFSTVATLLVAILIGRSYLVRGSPGLLLLGCGVVMRGAAGTISPSLLGHGPNTNTRE